MSFKEKYEQGNEFILSPNGKIGRLRYAVYALLLDLGYRFSFAFGVVLAKEVSMIFALLCVLSLFLVVLKYFNYTKRATAVFDNQKYGYIFAGGYMLAGVYASYYLYMMKLLTKASLGIPTMNIPSYIGNNFGQVTFYMISTLGIVMFFVLLFYPNKKIEETPAEPENTEEQN